MTSMSAGTTNRASLPEASAPAGDDLPRPGAAAAPNCPACGARMLRKTIRGGDEAGARFWGCSAFPRCEVTLSLDGRGSMQAAARPAPATVRPAASRHSAEASPTAVVQGASTAGEPTTPNRLPPPPTPAPKPMSKPGDLDPQPRLLTLIERTDDITAGLTWPGAGVGEHAVPAISDDEWAAALAEREPLFRASDEPPAQPSVDAMANPADRRAASPGAAGWAWRAAIAIGVAVLAVLAVVVVLPTVLRIVMASIA